jgi:hypothetical protein
MQYKYKRKYHPIGLFYILLINTISTIPLSATNNFCGESWSTTSNNCLSSQPCPLGTSSECTTPGQQCWGDTSCDTSHGHGILYNHDDPSHTRFCGISWEDASSNCNVDRHCPSGNDVDCPGSETCYLHLTEDCHYIDLLGGPEQAAITLNGGSNGSGSANKLDSDHPSRTNYCGYDWNSANECKDDHWCPSGSDSDCPPDKTCFAGTDCKYINDLVPTITPTNNPSSIPTMSPIKYETIENTSFCAKQWDETVNTCRIGSWCPSGDSRDCPSGYKCYTWITGCNILDFQNYYEEHNQEIFGVEHWLLPEGGLPGVEDVVVSSESGSSSNKVPQLPPAEISSQLGLTSPAEAEAATADESSIPVASPAEINNNVVPQVIRNEPLTPQPTPFDPDRYVAANHVFCGQTHTDAAARCSPETFCTDGAATHNCDKVGDYCWAGITTCNAGEWKNRPKTSPPSESLSPSEGMVETSRPTPQWSPEPTESPTFDPNSIMGVPDGNYDISSDGSYTVNGIEMRLKQMSYCATNYNDLMANCATARNCNKWQPCPSGYECYSNVKCLVPMDETWDTSSSTVVTDKPTFPPITMSPIAEPPASWGSPILTTPTTNPPSSSQPTVYTLSEDEVKQRLSYPNNYCSSSLSEVMSSCSFALHTCNADDRMCPSGTVCFENIQCPNPDETEAPVVSSTRIESVSPTSAPVHRLTLKPISEPVMTTNAPTAKMTPQPTISPSVKSVSPQNYCTTSILEIQSTCATAQTCNDGEPLCPFGMFCMTNYLCSSDDEKDEATPPTIPSNENQGNGKAVAQNYCAQWEEELVDICTWTYTCNEGDPPCPTDTYCFENYICEGRADGETETLSFAPTTPAVDVTDIDISTTQQTLDCSELCLQAIGPSDCKDVQSSVVINMNNILPCTDFTVSVGHLCKGTGECGTDTELNNCGDGHDIYFRLESSKCIEHGLSVGYGVIPPPDIKELVETEEIDDPPDDIVLEDKATSTSTHAPPLQDKDIAIVDESISDKSTNSDYDWDNWPPRDSELDSFNDNAENDGLGSWWLMKENHARRGAPGSWIKNMIATLLTGVVLSFMA